jgi:hypothetical protein
MSKTRSQILTFASAISEEKKVSLSELITLWNKLNIDNKISEEEEKAGKVLEKESGCVEKMKSGESKGMRCGKKCVDGKERCPAHQKHFDENQNTVNCKELTKKNIQCSRKATVDGYCLQHYGKKMDSK